MFLIDGYNLLHATDLFGSGELAGTLRGSREALLDFLARRLTAREREATVIVFDAADAPPGLPDRVRHAGIDVRYARGYPDADAMIEALLEGRHRAKGLTVVSGDRRVQRAARSSGARWVDSEPWFVELCRRPEEAPELEKALQDVGSRDEWVAEFSDPAALEAIRREAAAAPDPAPPRPAEPPAPPPAAEPPPAAPARKKRKKRRPPLGEATDKPTGAFGAGVFDPFPPGYADDLVDPESGDDAPPGGADSAANHRRPD